MLGMFAMAVIGGTISGGLNASAQQAKIEDSVCQMANQMATYKTLMSSELDLLVQEDEAYIQKSDAIKLRIQTIKDTIKDQHYAFKQTYNMWVVISIIFLILLVFLFATKKFLLGASTEN